MCRSYASLLNHRHRSLLSNYVKRCLSNERHALDAAAFGSYYSKSELGNGSVCNAYIHKAGRLPTISRQHLESIHLKCPSLTRTFSIMSNTMCYENSFADIHSDATTRIAYIRCTPPGRLRPKGTLILLHDFFKTNYQFRHVIDLFAMAGFITISPDLPGRMISAQQQPDSRINMDSLCSDLASFIRHDIITEPVHLVGDGMGAWLASTFASRHRNSVASVMLVDAQRSEKSEEALKFLSGLSAKVPRAVRRNAFDRYLDIQHKNASLLSSEDLDEYTDSFSDSRTLLNMQQACYNSLSTSCNLKDALNGTTSLPWLPEEQPEDFAVAVLGAIRLSTQQKAPKLDMQSKTHASRL